MVTPGAACFSNVNKEHRLEVVDTDKGVLLVVKGDTHNGITATIGLTVDADDLVRTLITASPAAVVAIGDVARAMIEKVLAD